MRLAMLLLIAASLPACSTPSMTVVALAIPALPAMVASPCPLAELLAGPTLGELALADARLATAYALCTAKHAAAVDSYNAVREAAEKAR